MFLLENDDSNSHCYAGIRNDRFDFLFKARSSEPLPVPETNMPENGWLEVDSFPCWDKRPMC